MAKEILLYTDLYSYSTERLINALDENLKKEVRMRVNSPGGSVFASYGIFAKVKEHGNVTMHVDGMAASAAGLMLLYAKKVTALNVCRIMLHRADAYISTPEQRVQLDSINVDLRKQLEMRVDNAKFKAVTGSSFEDLFNPETRIDIWLTADQAKELKIVSEIIELKPEEAKAMSDLMWDVAAKLEGAPEPKIIDNPKTEDTMTTLDELKAKYPVLYQQAVEAGHKAGVTAERDRVGAWMAWIGVDQKKVIEGIEKGEGISAKASQELQVSAMSGDYLKNLSKDSNKGGNNNNQQEKPTPGGAGASAEMIALETDLDKQLGIKKTA